MHRIHRASLALALVLAMACSDSNSLGDPTEENTIDTVTIGALEGTSIATPSGYSIFSGAVRTDSTINFEFAYNVRRLSDGTFQRVFMPRGALGLSTSTADPGVQRRDESFDDLDRARSNGYVVDSAVPVQLGERYLVRSRVVCSDLGVPLYGKLEILAFQDSTVTFKVLTDRNCGFKDLLPGLPEN